MGSARQLDLPGTQRLAVHPASEVGLMRQAPQSSPPELCSFSAPRYRTPSGRTRGPRGLLRPQPGRYALLRPLLPQREPRHALPRPAVGCSWVPWRNGQRHARQLRRLARWRSWGSPPHCCQTNPGRSHGGSDVPRGAGLPPASRRALHGRIRSTESRILQMAVQGGSLICSKPICSKLGSLLSQCNCCGCWPGAT